MPVPKFLSLAWDEIVLLRTYVVAIVKGWGTIVTSGVAVGLIWLFAYFREKALSGVVPYLPDKVLPGLTFNRLVLFSVFFVLATAQYMAWREAWTKRGTPEKPYLPKGLKMERQTPSFNASRPLPEGIDFVLVASEDLRGKAIRVFCSEPAYEKSININREYAGWKVVRDDDANSFFVNLASEDLAAEPFTVVHGEVLSNKPIRVVRVEWAKPEIAALARPSY